MSGRLPVELVEKITDCFAAAGGFAHGRAIRQWEQFALCAFAALAQQQGRARGSCRGAVRRLEIQSEWLLGAELDLLVRFNTEASLREIMHGLPGPRWSNTGALRLRAAITVCARIPAPKCYAEMRQNRAAYEYASWRGAWCAAVSALCGERDQVGVAGAIALAQAYEDPADFAEMLKMVRAAICGDAFVAEMSPFLEPELL